MGSKILAKFGILNEAYMIPPQLGGGINLFLGGGALAFFGAI